MIRGVYEEWLAVEALPRPRDELVIERVHVQLLGITCARPTREQLVVKAFEGDEIENLDLVRREIGIPDTRATPGQHRYPLGLDVVPPKKPPEVWNPIEQLVTNFADERPREDRFTASSGTSKLEFRAAICKLPHNRARRNAKRSRTRDACRAA